MTRRDRSGAPEGDEDFAAAMHDVRPLEHDTHPPGLTVRPPVAIANDEREVLRELDRLVSGESDFELGESDERLEGRVRGLDPRVARRLRRGEFTVQADLDLHGVDARTARGLVERLLVDAWERGLRCVRIVHGRGRNSPGGEPVLKPLLPRWLARGPARRAVLAYSSATARDGGTGATYVLLRARRARRPRPKPL
jgi:DNA-nicking Smr family endonuclease